MAALTTQLHEPSGRPSQPATCVGVVDAVSPVPGSEATSVIILSPGLARPNGVRPRSSVPSQPVGAGPGAGPGWPEGSAQHWPPSGGRRRRFGLRSGWLAWQHLIWVLLVWGRRSRCLPKPLSQAATGALPCHLPARCEQQHLFGRIGRLAVHLDDHTARLST